MLGLNKKAILIFAFLAIALIVAFSLSHLNQRNYAYKKSIGEKEALFVIDYGQGRERWFKGEVVNGMSVHDVFQVAAEAGDFEIDFAPNQRWRCYLNDQEIKEGLDEKMIYPKDRILCFYK